MEELIGIKYNKLTIIDEVGKNKYGRLFLCECDCPDKNRIIVTLNSLKTNNTKSCGCLKLKQIKNLNKSHGYWRSEIYNKWDSIIQRCCNKNNPEYKDYGGRGITICDEWKNDPIIFIKWAFENGFIENKRLQIDRRNNNGNYEPSNCRFVTNMENSHNTRLIKRNNKSGYRGVSFYNTIGCYVAEVLSDGKKVFKKGGFTNPFDAAMVRDKFIIKNRLPHLLNFPELKFWT